MFPAVFGKASTYFRGKIKKVAVPQALVSFKKYMPPEERKRRGHIFFE
jgi:hypothetical protein